MGTIGAEKMLGFPIAMLAAGVRYNYYRFLFIYLFISNFTRCIVVSVIPVLDIITTSFMACMYDPLLSLEILTIQFSNFRVLRF